MKFSERNLRRCESPNGFNQKLESWSLGDWFMAFIGEFGEAANIGKKLNRVRDGIPGNKETPEQLKQKMKLELGDAAIYLDLMAQHQGFSGIDECRDFAFESKSKEIGYIEPSDNV
jgi:hypothetical protein